MAVREADLATPFGWGAFYLRCAGATLVVTLLAVLVYVLAHQFLLDWTVIDPRHERSLGLGERLLVFTKLVVRALLEAFSPTWMSWAIPLAAPVVAFVLIGLRIRGAESAGGTGLAAQLGARPIEPTSRNPVDRFLLECVAAETRARGVAAPPLFLLDELETVCAATLGTGRGDAALVLSKGAVESLDPAALRAVLAWQLAALDGGRLERDARVAAFVHPLLVPWLIGDAFWTFEQWLNRIEDQFRIPAGFSPLFWFFISVRFALHALRLLSRVAGFPGLAAARLILRDALKEDVFLRDLVVARSLPDREALAAALARARPRDEEVQVVEIELFAANASAVEFAHLFFAEPLPIPHEPRLRWIAARLRSHVDPGERIRRISPGFDLGAYEKRRAAADAEGALPAMAHGAPDETWLAKGPLRPAMTTPVVRFDATDPAEASRREEFFLRFSRALLEHFRTPQGASRLLLATTVPAAPGGESLRPELEKLGARERRWVIERCLGMLATAPEAVRAAHLRAQRIVMEADRRITLDELVDWLFVERALVHPPAPTAAGTDGSADALLILATLAWAGTSDARAAAIAHARGAALVAPGTTTRLPDRRELSAAEIERALHRLQSGGVGARADLVKACLAVARTDGGVSEAEEELLRRLCYILSVAPSVLRPASIPAATKTSPMEAVYAPPDDSTLLRHAQSASVTTSRACARCAGRAELRRYTTRLRDAVAEWVVPVVAFVAIGVALFLVDAPHRSVRPGAWTSFIGSWVLLSVVAGVAYGLLVQTSRGLYFPRWAKVSFLVALLAGSVVFYLLDPSQGLGVPLGGMLVVGGMLVYELTQKPRIPPGSFYFCRGCGLVARIDDTIRGEED